jgi:hypothetical protein
MSKRESRQPENTDTPDRYKSVDSVLSLSNCRSRTGGREKVTQVSTCCEISGEEN